MSCLTKLVPGFRPEKVIARQKIIAVYTDEASMTPLLLSGDKAMDAYKDACQLEVDRNRLGLTHEQRSHHRSI